MSATTDAVHHPAHYQTAAGIEAIDVIEALVGLDGHAANAIKYILRHKAKGRPAEDLAKAKWYVDRLRTSAVRVEPQPERGDTHTYLRDVIAAFGLTGNSALAMISLSIALRSVAEDRYRQELEQCSWCLRASIAQIECEQRESAEVQP